MTKEARIETRNEICRAHFNLGSNDVSKSSYSLTLRISILIVQPAPSLNRWISSS